VSIPNVGIEPVTFYRRFEDMSPTGSLTVVMENDGDMILSVFAVDEISRKERRCEVQFCTFAGGGRSKRTREALIMLAEAIRLDNLETPQERP